MLALDTLDDISISVVQVHELIKSYLLDSLFADSCNGMVCVFKDKMHDLFLINPTTKKIKKIPHWPHDFHLSLAQLRISCLDLDMMNLMMTTISSCIFCHSYLQSQN